MGYEVKNFLIKAPFLGLNTEIPAYILPPNQSPSLINVELRNKTLHSAYPFSFLMQQGNGTVSVDGTSVTGVGTNFSSDLIGDLFIVGNQKSVVKSVESSTSLTLVEPFQIPVSNQNWYYQKQLIPSEFKSIAVTSEEVLNSSNIILGMGKIKTYTSATGPVDRLFISTSKWMFIANNVAPYHIWRQVNNVHNKGTVNLTAGSNTVYPGSSPPDFFDAYNIYGRYATNEGITKTQWFYDTTSGHSFNSRIQYKNYISGTGWVLYTYNNSPGTWSDDTYKVYRVFSPDLMSAVFTYADMAKYIINTMSFSWTYHLNNLFVVPTTANPWGSLIGLSGKYDYQTNLKRVVLSYPNYEMYDVETDITYSSADGNINRIKPVYIESWKNHLVCGITFSSDTAGDLKQIRLSQSLTYNIFQPSTSNDAYFVSVPIKKGYITGIKVLEDELYIFSQDEIWVAKYVGLPSIITLTQLSTDIGCIAYSSIVSYKNIMFFLHYTGIYCISGYRLVKISEQVQTKFESLIKKIIPERTRAYYYEPYNAYYIWFQYNQPEGNYYGELWVYYTDIQGWAIFKFPKVSIGGFVEGLDGKLWVGIMEKTSFADNSGNPVWWLYVVRWDEDETDPKFLFNPLESVYYTPIFDFGNPYVVKRLNKIQFLTDKPNVPQKLYVTVYYGDTPDGLTSSQEYVVEDITQYPYLDVSFKARFFQIKIRANSYFSLVGINFIYMDITLKEGTKAVS